MVHVLRDVQARGEILLDEDDVVTVTQVREP
jgi:hypothetical protein